MISTPSSLANIFQTHLTLRQPISHITEVDGGGGGHKLSPDSGSFTADTDLSQVCSVFVLSNKVNKIQLGTGIHLLLCQSYLMSLNGCQKDLRTKEYHLIRYLCSKSELRS
jgi:hypothetical protein